MDGHTWSARSEEVSIHFQCGHSFPLENIGWHTIADFRFGRNEIDGAWYYVWRSSSREAARSSVPENGNRFSTPLKPSSLSGKFVSRVLVCPPIFKFGAETRWQDARAAPAAARRSWARQASSGSLEESIRSWATVSFAGTPQRRVWPISRVENQTLDDGGDRAYERGAGRVNRRIIAIWSLSFTTFYSYMYIILTILQTFSSYVSAVKCYRKMRDVLMIKPNQISKFQSSIDHTIFKFVWQIFVLIFMQNFSISRRRNKTMSF